jgi:hypothetical protein
MVLGVLFIPETARKPHRRVEMEAATGGAGTAAATGGGGAAAAASFVFKDPSVYDTLGVSEDEKGFPIVELPVGAKVFRADREGAVAPSTEVPAFFGNRVTISPYTKPLPGKKALEETSTLSAYTITKSPRLFHMTLESVQELFNSFVERINTAGINESETDFLNYSLTMLSQYFPPGVGVVIPSLPTPPSPFSKPSEKHRSYMNRTIADILCHLGYDGWIVKPFNLKERQGLEQVSIVRLKEISDKTKIPLPVLLENPKALERASISYPPEIMLCNWSAFMEPASLEGGGRRRAKTRRQRYRRRRTHRN